MEIEDTQLVVHTNARAKGFWESYDQASNEIKQTMIAEKLALIHSEVSEALECLREVGTHSWVVEGDVPKPAGWGPELADIVIRVLDLAEATDTDLAHWIDVKHTYNKTRPVKHGKRF